MKKIIAVLGLAIASTAGACGNDSSCAPGLTDKTVNYCPGSRVYLTMEGRRVIGPLELLTVDGPNRGIIRLPNSNITSPAIPSIELAVSSGCGPKSGICVGDRVTHSRAPGIWKIVGRFENDIFVGAKCFDDLCEQTSAEGPTSILIEMDREDLSKF